MRDMMLILAKKILIIGCRVLLWRPLEIFLHDWRPIRAEARLYVRPSGIDVSVRGMHEFAKGVS
jgi:hypothetical protein